MATGIVIRVDGTVARVEYKEPLDSKDVAETTGCRYIEEFARRESFVIFVDEEGGLNGSRMNLIALKYPEVLYRYASFGDAVILGRVDGEGITHGLTELDIEAIELGMSLFAAA